MGYLKPEAGFWREAFKWLSKVQKQEVLVWDDSQPAVDSAREFGFHAEYYRDTEAFKKIMREKYQLRV